MITVWKFPLKLVDEHGNVTDRPIITMPKKAVLLALQLQNDVPTVWALVDTDSDVERRRFLVVGTGQPLPNDGYQWAYAYLGTWQQNGFVFHLFEPPRHLGRQS
ncbi:hypothetical protein BAY59_10945 [Prauserella coralliicola]|nr:hypothetical protein BAY59_10945 [Prauserella coralliicola]